jgi:hypothetical protein
MDFEQTILFVIIIKERFNLHQDLIPLLDTYRFESQIQSNRCKVVLVKPSFQDFLIRKPNNKQANKL